MKQGVDFGYGIKSTIAQCFVLTTAYFLNVQQGIDVMMPTIIIGAMRNNDSNIIYLTEEEYSWIGSLVYISPPIGSIFLSIIQSRLGHKICIVITNLIQFSSALIVVIFPLQASTLYTCSILMGLSTGFATGLSISYSGEVCEPKLRGSLTSALNVFYFVGYFFVTITYAITNNWKMSLLITIVVPVLNCLALLLTPDSPIWLLSKGKIDKAKKNLRKIRGYASEEKCVTEFQEMVQYVSQSTKSEEAKQKSFFTFDSFCDPGLWTPLRLMVIYIFFSNLMSGVPYTPHLVYVFSLFQVPVNAAWATAVYTVFSIVGNVFAIVLVPWAGKRLLVFSTIIVCSLSYFLIGIIGLFCADTEFNAWTKSILFCVSTFSSSLGVMPIGWIYISEIFPMKCKNLGCNTSTAFYFFLSFIMTKFYMDLQILVSFYGTFVLFGGLGLGSLIYFYFYLPETENKTLKEIAEQFKMNKV